MNSTLKQKSYLSGVATAAPLLIVLAAFLLWPLLVMGSRSLSGEGGIAFTTYLDLLKSSRYHRSFIFTTWLALCSTLITLIICIPSAIYLEGPSSRARKIAAVLLTVPLSLPGIVIGFFVILGFGRTGIVTDIVKSISDLRNPQIAYTFWGLLLGYVYFQIPRVVLVLRGAVNSISTEVVSVARTLGASPWRVYLEVVLPTLRPALLSATSLSLATSFGAFGTAATLTQGTRVVPLEISALFTETFKPAEASALSLLLALFTITLLLGVGRLAERPNSTKAAENTTKNIATGEMS